MTARKCPVCGSSFQPSRRVRPKVYCSRRCWGIARRARGLAPDDPRHGTANGYNNLGCRCEPCTDAWRVMHHKWLNADPERLKRHAERERRRRAVSA